MKSQNSGRETIERGPIQQFHKCCPTDPAIRTHLDSRLARDLSTLPAESDIKQLSAILRALSHPLRLKLALLLVNRDYCVCELVQLTGKKPNLVSHHLGSLRKMGVVGFHRESGWKYYRLSETAGRLMRGCCNPAGISNRTVPDSSGGTTSPVPIGR